MRNGTTLFARGLVIAILAGSCGRKVDSHEGHQHGSMEEKAGTRSKGQGSGCAAHGAPKNQCFICDASLRDPQRLWCKEHGRYEDRCFLCHPELKDAARLFCEEHGLYEDECFICHPEVEKTSSTDMPAGGDVHGKGSERLMCGEHGVFEDECGSCHPELVENLEPGKGVKLRFASKESTQKAGIVIGKPARRGAQAGAGHVCRVTFNEERYAKIAARVPGTVLKVHAAQGSRVAKGQLLAEIHSAEAAGSKSEYVSSSSEASLKEALYRRERDLVQQNVSSLQEAQQAKADFEAAAARREAAKQKLLNLGLTADEVGTLGTDGSSSPVLRIRAPFAGTVVEKSAVAGQNTDGSEPLFALADLSTMWIHLSVPAVEARHYRAGDSVTAKLHELAGKEIRAAVIWVSPQIDPDNRTVTVRMLAQNRDNELRGGMYGEAVVATPSGTDQLGLPSGAIQRISGKDYAFIKLEDDLFDVRRVLVGTRSGDWVAVDEGIAAGEPVIVAGSFTARSELQKAKFGAGCADH